RDAGRRAQQSLSEDEVVRHCPVTSAGGRGRGRLVIGNLQYYGTVRCRLFMTDSSRPDGSRAIDAAADPDRDAKIEQLLLSGLDHYFSAHYDQAINVWTRALFFDRSHPRARAYIERARSALAERQRESEELLHKGVAALDRGEGAEA